MKDKDWNGYPVNLLAHAFNLQKGVGVHNIHIRASTEEEAHEKVMRKLEHRQDFIKDTKGVFQIKYDKIVPRLEH